MNVLTIKNGITFLTSLESLVTRTQLDRPKIKGPLKRVDIQYYDGNCFKVLCTLHTLKIFKQRVKKTVKKISITGTLTVIDDFCLRKSVLDCHSTVFRLLWNLHSEPFGVAYLKIYATEQSNTTSAW